MTIKRDANQLAARILRFALRHHDDRESARALEMRKAWRAARAINRAKPVGTAPRLRPLTPEQLARIGTVEGL
jgi:hypothetical protein